MTTRQMIKRFFEPAYNKPFNFIVCGLFSLLSALHAVSYARYFQKITMALESGDSKNFFIRIIVLCATAIVWFLIKLSDRKYFFSAVNEADNYIYAKYISKYFYADNTNIERIGTARIISIVKSGVNYRSYMIAEVFWDHLKVAFIIIISLSIIGYQSLIFFLIVLIVLAISFYWIRIFGPKSSKRRLKNKNINTEIDRNSFRQIMSKFEILQNNKIGFEINKYMDYTKESLYCRNKEKFRQAIAYDSTIFMVNILRATIIGIIGYGVFTNVSTISDFVMIATLTGTLVATISDLSFISRKFSDGLVHIEKLWDVFDNISYSSNMNSGKSFLYKSGNIEFKNLSFLYLEGNQILSNFHIKIKGGKKTALVGPSGGGKSTLIKLIAGYINPDSGKVIIDNQNLSEVSLISYYEHIGYLTQEPSVFDGTIRENLQYGMILPSPSRRGVGGEVLQSIDTVLPLAKCERIYDLPHGLDTEIGERGVRLSGGQKQRLAIAKIMLKNPDIILLDEPTSALDSANEQAVTEALNNLFKNKTVIIIAHRLQTVKNADDIIYIADGKVVERGTHDELLALGGEYYKMVELQSGF